MTSTRKEVALLTLVVLVQMLVLVLIYSSFVSSWGHMPSAEKSVVIRNVNTTAAGAGLLIIEDELVKLDNNSTLAPDIINITHVRNGNGEESNMIVIHLKQERRCKAPQLVGRLSGPALSKVTWEKIHEDDHEAFLVGHYDVPVPSRFFIEIITTMCNELEHDTDFQPICLEDPTRHRLTHKDASIDAVPLRGGAHIHSNENPAGIIGYWHTNITKREKPVPLYTRYQPRGCREPEDEISARCEEATDVSRFDPYEFQFATDIRLQNRLEKKEGTVCFIGASHALHLTVRAQKILKERNVVSVNAKTTEGFHFAREYTEEEIQWINDQHCTKVIIGIGQWDASYWADMEYKGNAPTLFQEYEDDLKKAMAIMVDIFRDNNVDLYFRTTHYNPMGDFITACPPLDWRSPPVIDMYNDILRRLCKSFKIPLIDTNDIIGIMWDRAEDWCHYRDVSGDMETIYILDRIFA